MIRVLIAENAEPWGHFTAAVSRGLPADLVKRAQQYRRWQDAQAFLIGKLLLRKGLIELGFHERILEEIRYTEFGRPYLHAGVDFNISHAGRFVVAVFSANARIGVDIEAVNEVRLEDFTSCFTGRELERLSVSPRFLFDFFTIWTIKEAVIKADGRGLQVPLHQFDAAGTIVLAGNVWHLHPLTVPAGYVSYLATDQHTDISIVQDVVEF